jgi:hypothetical protein
MIRSREPKRWVEIFFITMFSIFFLSAVVSSLIIRQPSAPADNSVSSTWFVQDESHSRAKRVFNVFSAAFNLLVLIGLVALYRRKSVAKTAVMFGIGALIFLGLLEGFYALSRLQAVKSKIVAVGPVDTLDEETKLQAYAAFVAVDNRGKREIIGMGVNTLIYLGVFAYSFKRKVGEEICSA